MGSATCLAARAALLLLVSTTEALRTAVRTHTPRTASASAISRHPTSRQSSQDLTVFWSRLGRLVHHSGGNAEAAMHIDAAAHPACPEWVRDRDAALMQPRKQTVAQMETFSAQQLARTAHGIARIGLPADAQWIPVWSKLEEASVVKLADFNSLDLTNTVWAFAHVGYQAPRLFSKVATVAESKLHDFQPNHLSVTAWAYATAGHAAPRLMDAIAQEAVGRLSEFSTQALSNTAWAFARLNHAAPELISGIEVEVRRRIRHFKDQELVSLAWAFATLSHTPRPLFRDIAKEAKMRMKRLDGRALANLAWAFAVADHPSELLFGEGSRFAQRCAEQRHYSESGLRQLYQWELWRQERAAEWPPLPPKLRKRARKSFVSAAAHPSRLQRSVGKALGSLGLDTKLEQRTGEGYSVDLVVDTPDGRRFAIEVDGPSHFLLSSHTPTGATQLKRRQLRNFGHTVISLPFWEWQALHHKDPAKQEQRQLEYLEHALETFSP